MVKVTLIDLNDCQAGNCLPMKFSLYCPDLLGFQARPASCPGYERLSSKQPALPTSPPGPDGPAPRAQPGPERRRARPCGCPALLPVARKGRKDGDCNEISSLVVRLMIA